MGDDDMNHQSSAINNSTPLYSTPLHSPLLVMHGSSSSREPIRSDVVVVGSGAFHCLYCLLQSHRASTLESLLSMEYVWPKYPMVVVGIATK